VCFFRIETHLNKGLHFKRVRVMFSVQVKTAANGSSFATENLHLFDLHACSKHLNEVFVLHFQHVTCLLFNANYGAKFFSHRTRQKHLGFYEFLQIKKLFRGDSKWMN
jgi:hypothetical protein